MAAITGRKSGSSEARQPVESPDSIRSVARAKMLLALGEGEWEGGIDGTQILLDGTPAIAADGTENFPGFKWEFRPGTQYQDHIAGLPSVENEISVGVELRSSTPYVRSITNTELSAARVRLSWPSLQERKDNGDVVGYRIDYAIDVATDGGAWAELLTATINDKTTTKYERSHRIDLPASTSGWTLRVRRLTANKDNSNTIADVMRVEAVTEVIDAKLRYPNTALLYVEFDASQFQNIPKIACRAKMRIVRVPNNYDPQSRSYSGLWDGTFKWAWTDNPAWVFYDIVLSKRFGMGRRLDASMVDRWELYQIAQYCDELVSNGKGGMEPRFTCNIYIQSQADAWTVLRDVAAIFRGVSYWSGSQLIAHADMPSDIEYVFSRSNVVDGKFRYGGQSEKTNYSSALVSWDNPANGYQSEPEAVSIPSLVRRFGFNQTEITAVGCTRQSEANRRGRWLLLTNDVDRSVTFKTGLEGYLPTPGRIIGVADALLAGRQLAGRISLVSGRQITVDREAPIKVGDRLIVNLPSGKAEARTVQSVVGRVVTVTTDFSEAPKAQAQWGIESSDLVIQQYRITGITRADGGFEISAVMTDPGKYGQVDSGTRLESRPISVIPAGTQQAPTRVTLSTYTRIEQGMAVTTLRAQWEAAAGAVAYTAEWRKDSGEWIAVPRTSGLGFEVPGIYTGRYMVRVRAVNALDVSSLPAYSEETPLAGKVGLPPAVTSLATVSQLFGIGVNWGFPAGAEDTQRTELWYSPGTDVAAATKLSDLAYPQTDYVLQNLRAGAAFFFWARLVDRTGNVGPFYPTGVGVRGEASSDAGAILDQIAGQVGKSALGKELAAEIELISGNGPDSVNERLQEAKDLLAEQIAAVDTELASVKTELQEQIDTIADLADSMPYKSDQTYAVGQGVLGADGVIYQAVKAVPVNMPPPNTTYWLNVGQAVVTANGLAARVQTVETAITSVEGVNTAQAQQITGLRTDVDGKASASSVQSIGNRVTNAENSITSLGSAITGLNNNLTTTNTNVGNAQTAANNAAALAGSKGKVLVQAAVPAAADQVAQNLWIDITNGANTPKRWNGSAWTAVTDKVATDAANAAASALTQVQTKADASAVSALNNRVTATETAITSQSSSIVSLNNNLSYAGGENLAYNPDFVKPGADGTVAEGYLTDAPGSPGASTVVFSLVPSWLNTGEKAQRIAVTGLNQSALYRSIRNNGNRLPKVAEGQPVASSIFVRGTVGLGFRIFIQQVNASGGVLTTTNTVMYYLTGSTQRIALSVPSPVAGTVALVMFYRVYGSESVSDGHIELARPQVEYGSVATGWSNNGQVNTADLIATSSAVSSLGSRVDQQGAALTSTSNSLVNLSNTVAGVQGSMGAFGIDPATGGLWNFDTGAEGWTPANSTLSMASPGVLRQTSTSGDPSIKVDGLSINGALYTKVRASITRRAGTPATDWDGLVFYATSAHGFTANYYKAIPNPNLAVGESKVIEFDMTSLTAGGSDWTASTITSLRLDIGLSGSGVFDFEWIVVGRVSPAASSRALDSLTSTVNQQGGNLTSVSARTTSLENTVNSTSSGLGTKASASAVDTLANRVTAAEGVNKSQSTSITDLNNGVSTLQGNLTATSRALTSLSSEVTQQGDKLTAQATQVTNLSSYVGDVATVLNNETTARANADQALGQRVDTVQSTLGETRASVQQTSTALAGLNGQVNAQYSVKVMTTSGGMKVAAGFGIGLESEGGVTQGTFAVSADRFAVLPSNLSGTLTSPFTVENGQVFLADAYLKKATIQQGIVGQSLYSQTYTNYGQPVMNVDFNAGQILIQNRTTNGAYMFIREDGIFMVQNGVVVVELSMG